MYSKLSFRNMKRSISDYAIYFVTLMLAVCLFYTFSSISDQQILLDLNSKQTEYMSYLDDLITISSIVVSIIFCILCIFANQFLIKRRKKEFGLYMALGMGKFDVSKILIMETLLMSLLSLFVGIGVGVLISQSMSLVTASLFNVGMFNYQFIFSWTAALKTSFFFGLVFILVMIFNVVAVSQYSLIELLQASQKDEKQKIKSPVVNGILTLLSTILLVSGYFTILNSDPTKGFISIAIGGALLVVGTILFYFTSITLVMYIARKNKKFYNKGINSFNMRQIGSKINSAMVTLTTVSFLLFFTISILTNGMSYKKTLETELELVAPFDASISIFNYDNLKDFDLNIMLDKVGVDLNHHDYGSVNIYQADIPYQELLSPYATGAIKRDLSDGRRIEITAIKYSDYLDLIKLQGKEPINLLKNETLVLTNMNEAQETIINMTNAIKKYKIAGETLSLAEEKYQLAAVETETTGRTVACFVIDDAIADQLITNRTVVNLMYNDDNKTLNQQYEKRFEEMLNKDVLNDNRFYASGITKTTAIDEITGYTTNYIYVGIYLGIVFLIASGSVLGLRLLSNASDEQDRYKIIKRIGADDKMLTKSVLVQVSSYFLAPLILAIPNSIVIGAFISKQLTSTGGSLPIAPVVITTFMLLFIYGGYFIITFLGYKKIVTK